MGTIETEPLMNPEQVANLLNVKPATIYKMKERKLLLPVDLGIRSVRFRRADVEALMNNRRERNNAKVAA